MAYSKSSSMRTILKDFKEKPLAELRCILAKRKELYEDTAVINLLPDKGQKLGVFIENMEALVASKALEEERCPTKPADEKPAFQPDHFAKALGLVDQEETDKREAAKKQEVKEELEAAIPTDHVCSLHSKAARSEVDEVSDLLAKTLTLKADGRLKDMINEDGTSKLDLKKELRHKSLSEMNANELPKRPTRNSVDGLSSSSHQKTLMDSFPEIAQEKLGRQTKVVPLEESYKLLEEQKKKETELEKARAAERLIIRNEIRMQLYGCGGEEAISARDSMVDRLQVDNDRHHQGDDGHYQDNDDDGHHQGDDGHYQDNDDDGHHQDVYDDEHHQDDSGNDFENVD